MGLLKILEILWDHPASILRSRGQKKVFGAIVAVLFVWMSGCILFFVSFQTKNIETTRNLSVETSEVVISSKQVNFMDGSIFFQKVIPVNDGHDFALIWLHGAAFTSQTWINLEILQNIAKSDGYTSYAIDVPGYGKSSAPKLPYNDVDNNWLIAIIDNILKSEKQQRRKFVLVTPSMSGLHVMPLLLNQELQAQLKEKELEQIGLIAVAPVSTDKYEKSEYEAVKMPIGIIYGENDKRIGKVSLKHLSQIKDNTVYVIPNGLHPCYKTDPVLFTDFTSSYLKQFK